ncbi:urease accessory protein [Humitalea rosea]|uniref:Urease accessory protein UreE n=1 Tax=Humitalea rosea TaxID=990373 RepID=A0A2W7IM02_9PROT|nr:urease accessory protein UreE [Humitalea rosea]PZW48122.1 urease accessory protein [Humitalea rosea]
MLRATTILPAGSWTIDAARDTVTLTFDDRFRRRKAYTAEAGLAFLLDLPEATVLRDGDALRLDDGSLVAVRAAPEPLIEVTAGEAIGLARLAWHLGNRHLPAEIDGARILIRHDHVIEIMLRGLGAGVREVMAPFNPEGGAYGEHNRAASHPHAHHHDDHEHPHDHGDGHTHHH